MRQEYIVINMLVDITKSMIIVFL